MVCPVCFLFGSGRGVSLSNGEIVHSDCLKKLSDDLAICSTRLTYVRSRLGELQRQLVRQETMVGKLAQFFRGALDAKSLKAEVSSLEADIGFDEITYERLSKKLSAIYELMIDYPPDWSARCAAVIQRDRVCINCGSKKSLHVHHVLPLSKGGSNKLSNLSLLCERCHRKEHGNRNFPVANSSVSLSMADRVQLLNKAILNGVDVEFLYRKPTDSSYVKRRVTPRALVEVNHIHDEEHTLCLNGYCHLRRAERTFALKRMKAAKIVKM